MAESIHNKLERVRKPRVHIKYEVETEGAVVEKELPFVVGVLGDFSGDQREALRPFNERKFVQVDRDNFNEVMSRFKPGLNIRVKNHLSDGTNDIAVQLSFERMEDFEPEGIVEQVPALKSLLNARNELRDLLTKADRSERLEGLLEEVLQNHEGLARFAEELEKQDAKDRDTSEGDKN